MRATDGALLIVALAIAWSIYRAHRNPAVSLDVFDLLMENGRLSRIACAFMVTLVATTWIMIRLTFDGKMSEGFFIGYGGMWVAPIIAKLFTPAPTPGTTTTTDVTTRTQKTEKAKV